LRSIQKAGKAQTERPTTSPNTDTYDEQFTLTDASGRALTDTHYTVLLPSGERVYGVTDTQGRTGRYETDGARSIRIYLGHKEEV
jgi:uncharacterized protein (DUF2345 family)